MALNSPRNCRCISLYFFTALLLLGLCACSSEEKKQQAAPKALPVTAVKAVSRSVDIKKDFIGETRAVKTVEIRSKVEGYLLKRLFKEGGMVQEGQLLFKIDPKPFQEKLNQALANLHKEEASLAKAQTDFERFKALLDQDAISREEFDIKSTALKTTQAAVDGYRSAVQDARLDLGYTKIKSPMEGLIGKTEVNIGTLVSKEQTLLATVSAMDPMYVTFSIAERDYLLAKRNGYTGKQKQNNATEANLGLILADGDTYEYKGKLDMIDPTVDDKTGTLGVRAVFPNPDQILRPGQYAKIRAKIATIKNAVVIPSRALLDTQGIKSVLLVQNNGTVTNPTVKVQRVMNNIAIIKEGVKAGDVIVSEGVRRVRPGAQVNATIAQFSGELAGGASASSSPSDD